MERNDLKRGFLPLNIQLFAEPASSGEDGKGDPQPSNDPQPKTYSEEEYLKLKAAFDKSSSDLAKAKKDLAAKQSDEERKAAEEAEKQKQYEDLVKQNKEMKISSTLATAGYSEKDIQSLSKPLLEGNIEETCKVLSTLRKTMEEEITKRVQDEFNKSSKIPGGTGGSDNDIPEDIQAMIDAKKGKSKISAKDYFFGSKSEQK